MIKNSAIHFWCCMSAALCVSVFLPGCSSEKTIDRPTVVPVTGVVMYNGNPVSGATVTFMNEKSPRAASGVTNDKGEFQLTTFDPNDGAVLGVHKITVVKKEAGAAPSKSPEAMLQDSASITNSYTQKMGTGANAKPQEGPKSLIPLKYESIATSGLSEEVKAQGENRFPLQLSD
jgi:hypothetical protein